MSFKSGLIFFVAAGLAGAACHHDNSTPTNPNLGGGGQGSGGPGTVGGASTENSGTGGAAGSTPGDRYNNAGVDPATGMSTDGGVGTGDAGMR